MTMGNTRAGNTRAGLTSARTHALACATLASPAGSRRSPGALLALLLAAALLAIALLANTAQARPADTAGATPAAETNKAPKVTKQPTSVTVEEGQSASFTAVASGTPAPTVQWERSTNGGGTWAPIEGATAGTYTIASAKVAESASQYRAVFKNVAGEATSKVATLTVQKAPSVTKQPLSVTVEEGQTVVFEATASGSPAPTLKWETSANSGSTWQVVAGQTSPQLTLASVKSSLSGRQYRATFKNSVGEATTEAATLTIQNPPAMTKQPLSASVNQGQSAVFEATASGFPTPSVSWEVSTDGGASWSVVEGASSSQLTIASVSVSEDGYMFRAVFQNTAGNVQSQSATLTVHAPPVITQQPEAVIVEVGESAGFEATASGFPTPTLQWEVSTDEGKTWSALAGQTSPQLTIASPQLSESGRRFRAAFTNAAGKATSSAATLTVVSNSFSALAWGDNIYRQLGDGFAEHSSAVPVPVSNLRFVAAVAAGGRHSLALLANGTVLAWGANGLGQLGDGETAESSVPVPVHGLANVKALSAGASHSLALLKDGTVMAWGDNESGQLGIGSNVESSLLPVAVAGLSGVKAVSAGADHSLALLNNGTVMAWGANESGQLGTGTSKASNAPVAVKHLTGAVAVAAGSEYSLALLSNGTVVGWGNDEHGQLANVTVEEGTSNLPVAVEGLTGVSAIAAGAGHGLALLSGGTVMAWGEDAHGEVGNGTVKPVQATPVAVSGVSGASAISAGTQDSAALLASGSVMTWGTDSSGVLGNGVSSGISAVPVMVTGLSKAAAISVGRSHMLAYGEPIPTVTAVSPNIGSSAGGETVTISGSSLGEASAVKFGPTNATSFTIESSTSITAVVPPGKGTVDVSVTTPSGTSPPRNGDHYLYQLAPSVQKLSAKLGSAAGGTSVTLTGAEFTGATAVTFGTASASFTVNSATSITAVAPPGIGGTVDVHVSNAGGTSLATSKDHFKYLPVVEGLSPAGGPAAGGTSVTVTGSGFATGSAATSFKFGKVKAKSVTCSSSSSCTVIAPAQAPGTVDVVATANKAVGLLNAPADSFTYG